MNLCIRRHQEKILIRKVAKDRAQIDRRADHDLTIETSIIAETHLQIVRCGKITNNSSLHKICLSKKHPDDKVLTATVTVMDDLEDDTKAQQETGARQETEVYQDRETRRETAVHQDREIRQDTGARQETEVRRELSQTFKNLERIAGFARKAIDPKNATRLPCQHNARNSSKNQKIVYMAIESLHFFIASLSSNLISACNLTLNWLVSVLSNELHFPKPS